MAPTKDHSGLPVLDERRAADLARLAVRGLRLAYPYKPAFVHVGPESARKPSEVHAVFWGSYDWHSSVHGHWMLVRLLKLRPDHPLAAESRALLQDRLTDEGLRAEAAFFGLPENQSFERMYGWAWLFRLAAELEAWDDPQARVWRRSLRPLERRLVTLTLEYLPRLGRPIRSGVHSDTGFALSQTLDYAGVTQDGVLEALVLTTARRHYLEDRDYPAVYEPSGQDFFSPGLNEADLMRRVLAPQEFLGWLDRFLPGLARGEAGNLLTPVEVSDPGDPLLVHLAGLDLSRAWTLLGIASTLPADDDRRAVCEQGAAVHAAAGLRHVASGHYEGEHWLASFAVYLLGGTGLAEPPRS